jgi:hypothetical protein
VPDNPENPINNDQTHAEPVDQQPRDLTLAERIDRDHPDWPPFKLHFYFSSHETPLDMPDLKDQLQGADIYLYEAATGNTMTEELQEFADAEETNDQDTIDEAINLAHAQRKIVKGTAMELEARALFGSKVRVGHIDLRPGDPIFDHYPGKYEKEFPGFQKPTFDQTLDYIKERAELNARFHEEREKIMINRFEQELADIITAHPNLKKTPELKIVATMGASHTTLYDKFIAEGIQTEHTFPEGHDFNDAWKQTQHAILADVEPSRELLAKVYLEEDLLAMVDAALAGQAVSTDSKFDYITACASLFTTAEIETLHGQNYTLDIFNDILHAKGLPPLPRNSAEIQAFVGSQRTTQEKTAAEKAEHPHVRPTQKD